MSSKIEYNLSMPEGQLTLEEDYHKLMREQRWKLIDEEYERDLDKKEIFIIKIIIIVYGLFVLGVHSYSDIVE